MDRVCIFIDGSNFYHALKDAELSVCVDLGKLSLRLSGPDRRHLHTYYYNTPLIRPRRDDPQYQGQRTLNSLCRKDFRQEFVAPTGQAAFPLDAVFGRMAFQQTDREAA